MKMLNSIFLKIQAFLSVSAVSAFADEFTDIANAVIEVSKDGMSVFGTIMIWFFAVFLPIGCILGGILFGYKQRNKQAEQDKNSIKIYIIFAYGFVGLFVFIVAKPVFHK